MQAVTPAKLHCGFKQVSKIKGVLEDQKYKA